MTDRSEGFQTLLGSDPPPAEDEVARALFQRLKRGGEASGPGGLRDAIEGIRQQRGLQPAFNVLNRLEVALGFRRPTLGLYDNAMHFIGGAQKYGCTLAQALQETFDITLLVDAEVTIAQLESWYGLDLSRCRIKVVRLPYFEEREAVLGV